MLQLAKELGQRNGGVDAVVKVYPGDSLRRQDRYSKTRKCPAVQTEKKVLCTLWLKLNFSAISSRKKLSKQCRSNAR